LTLTRQCARADWDHVVPATIAHERPGSRFRV